MSIVVFYLIDGRRTGEQIQYQIRIAFADKVFMTVFFLVQPLLANIVVVRLVKANISQRFRGGAVNIQRTAGVSSTLQAIGYIFIRSHNNIFLLIISFSFLIFLKAPDSSCTPRRAVRFIAFIYLKTPKMDSDS